MIEDERIVRPLQSLAGAVPPAPKWFADAIAASFEAFSVAVDGAAVDCRAWGERGKPGLVLVHGAAAHLGWWAFLAPFFAPDHRVVALSLSGMGASDWREDYSVDSSVAQVLAAAEAGGAFVAGPPTFVGHSAGGFPVLRIAARHGERVHAAVIVDTILPASEDDRIQTGQKHRVYPDLPAALARFRLAPPQPCENVFIADYLARMGLGQVDGGWSWRFDPRVASITSYGDCWSDLTSVGGRLALLRGESSALRNDVAHRMSRTAPSRTLIVDLPEAYHHIMIDQPMALVSTLRALLAGWR